MKTAAHWGGDSHILKAGTYCYAGLIVKLLGVILNELRKDKRELFSLIFWVLIRL